MKKISILLVLVCFVVAAAVPAFAQQPPRGMKTARTYITPSGGHSSESRDAVRVDGFRVGFWGAPCCPMDKPGMLQRWVCDENEIFNAIFTTEAEAKEFIRNPQRGRSWRSAIDNTPLVPDPSAPKARQATLPMK